MPRLVPRLVLLPCRRHFACLYILVDDLFLPHTDSRFQGWGPGAESSSSAASARDVVCASSVAARPGGSPRAGGWYWRGYRQIQLPCQFHDLLQLCSPVFHTPAHLISLFFISFLIASFARPILPALPALGFSLSPGANASDSFCLKFFPPFELPRVRFFVCPVARAWVHWWPN
jgi:hypothetical protein